MNTTEKEILLSNLRGLYRTGGFHIHFDGRFYQDMSQMSIKDLGTFFHEYIHFLQNISTPFGICESNALYHAAIEVFNNAQNMSNIDLPIDIQYSKTLQEELNYFCTVRGDGNSLRGYFGNQSLVMVDLNKKIEIKSSRKGKTNVYHIYFFDTLNQRHERQLGSVDIKEGMAAACQRLIDKNALHPDVPYNILFYVCKQEFPSLCEDVKQFIYICFSSLFSTNPITFFFRLCNYHKCHSTSNGLDIFHLMWKNDENIWGMKDFNIESKFNKLIEQYRNALTGFSRTDNGIINYMLDKIKELKEKSPIIEIIKPNVPMGWQQVKLLVDVLGMPYVWDNYGEHICRIDGEENSATGMIQLVGNSLLFEYLTNRSNPMTIGVCPFYSICGDDEKNVDLNHG